MFEGLTWKNINIRSDRENQEADGRILLPDAFSIKNNGTEAELSQKLFNLGIINGTSQL
jgi:hypothetical protein